jgi:DNA-binding MurR/RpiR family transcriptional regulator
VNRQHNGNGGAPDLKKLIQARYPTLPENQRKVADFLLLHVQEVPFLSILQIERQSGTSKATVVRLAQSLGYSGFHELRSRLRESARSSLGRAERFSLLHPGDQEDTLAVVAQQDVSNISQTIAQLDRKAFREAAQMLQRAPAVWTAGLGISSLMAKILAYSLHQVGLQARPLAHDEMSFLEQIPLLSPPAVLVVFSFPPYSRETIDLAHHASGRGVPVIAITDRVTSPVTHAARLVLPIRSENLLFTNSISAISVLINALATEIAVRNRRRALRRLRETEDLLRTTGHYHEE